MDATRHGIAGDERAGLDTDLTERRKAATEASANLAKIADQVAQAETRLAALQTVDADLKAARKQSETLTAQNAEQSAVLKAGAQDRAAVTDGLKADREELAKLDAELIARRKTAAEAAAHAAKTRGTGRASRSTPGRFKDHRSRTEGSTQTIGNADGAERRAIGDPECWRGVSRQPTGEVGRDASARGGVNRPGAVTRCRGHAAGTGQRPG